MAYMASLFMNAMVKVFGKRGARTYNLEEFMPEWDEEAREMRPQQTMQQMKDTLLSLRGTRKRKGKIDDEVARKRKPVKEVKK